MNGYCFSHSKNNRDGFTLIELLVVIAIIAILTVVVILTINPAELLRQSRDSQRVSDMATISSAINLYAADQSSVTGFTLGNASSVYISIPDNVSSTCGSVGALPYTGLAYACATSTSSHSINGFGWIPVNLQNITAGTPLSSFPIDPTNSSSSGLYYSYYGSGTQFAISAAPESQKYKASFSTNPMITNYPDIIANGSNFGIMPLSPIGTRGLLDLR